MMNNHIYEEIISPFLENDSILDQLGYGKIGFCFKFKQPKKDVEHVKRVLQVATDLIVLQGKYPWLE